MGEGASLIAFGRLFSFTAAGDVIVKPIYIQIVLVLHQGSVPGTLTSVDFCASRIS